MAPAQSAINLLIWTVPFTILDALFVGLRFWAARIVRRKLAADDYLIVISLITTFALEGVMIWGIFNGMGKRATELSPSQLKVQYQTIPATYVTWTVATTSFKLSVLCLYVRILSWPLLKKLSYILMGLTFAYCVSFLATFLTTCSPDISQLWNPRPDGHCRDLNIGQLGSVSTNLALDVFIIALPMPFLWSLKMRKRNKLVVTLAFSLGFITIGIMIWRIYDLVSTAKDPNADFVHHLPILALTTTLELWLCIIIACIPTIGPIIKAHVKPLVSKLSGGSSADGLGGTPLQIITFGRGRFSRPRRDHGGYTDVLGSQDPITEDVEANPTTPSPTAQELRTIRKDTVLNSQTSPLPVLGENYEPFSAHVEASHPGARRNPSAQP